MKKDNNSTPDPNQRTRPEIPDIEIIDLEAAESGFPAEGEDETLEEITFEDEAPEDETLEKTPKKRGFHFYMHFVLLATVLLVVAIAAYRVTHWGRFISQEEIFRDGEGTYEDNFDSIFPVEDENGNIMPPDHDGNGLTILALGNAPFADDADSEDSLAVMIEELTGGTVINCAVSGSYAASVWNHLSPEDVPMDAYTPYWLCALAMNDEMNRHYEKVAQILGDDRPPEADYVFETLSNIDLNDIDVVTFMFDASDYLMGHPMYNDENPTDIQQFTGNLEAGLELLQSNYPHLRIIVLSPTYAFGIDENGDYISSDIQRYGQDVLSTYVIRQCFSCNSRGVTFVDNLYGTITEDNAGEYLTDNLHLNAEGRRLVAERFLYALTYYGE